MAFGWLGLFATHQYLALRDYLLQELRSVGSMALQIDTELERIGYASIIWEEDENGSATEKRLGMIISPQNSSLGKLMKAYIAKGGNPFDICDYLVPDEGVEFVYNGESDELEMKFNQPYGGVASVRTRESPTEGFDEGGELIYGKNFRLRAGKEIRMDRAEVVGGRIAGARAWANQGIKEKRNDLEWRIVKLLDLSDQLQNERKERLLHDVSGMIDDVALEETDSYQHTLKAHIETIDRIIFQLDENAVPKYGTVNLQNLIPGNFDYIIPSRQLGEDDWVAGKTPWNFVMSGEERVDIAQGIAAPNTGLDEET